MKWSQFFTSLVGKKIVMALTGLFLISFLLIHVGLNSTIFNDLAIFNIEAAMCIGCGACVSACKNASASLFTAAKIAHLGLLPQGKPELKSRALNMVAQMEKELFGSCTFTGACEAVCPKEIPITNISRMHKNYLMAGLSAEK